MSSHTELLQDADVHRRQVDDHALESTGAEQPLGVGQEARPEESAGLNLPEIPSTEGLDFDLSAIIGSSSTSTAVPSVSLDKVTKRQSNVQKLALENEKLKAELKAMSDRLEAAEKRKQELAEKQRLRQAS